MARPLRIEFPGAIYHVTSRGDRSEPIFADDVDRRCFLAIVEKALDKFSATAMAYCLMGNHYHFVMHTTQANLSGLMRHLNGVYSQTFNRRHGQVGHMFQGRFHAVIVDRDAYLLEACRYVELNPVRAGMVSAPQLWPWSSYRSHAGLDIAPRWLDTELLHACLVGRDPASDERQALEVRYAQWVAAGRNVRLWDEALRQQIYLGDDTFVRRTLAQATPDRLASRHIPLRQRTAPKT